MSEEWRELGVNGMVEDFVGQAKFTIKYEEDFDDIRETYGTYAGMCDLSQSQMGNSMPLILGGNALSHFNKESKALQIIWRRDQSAEFMV